MKLTFSAKEKITIAAALLILILYIVYAQFYYLSPLKSNLTTKQQSLKSEQQLLTALQQKGSSKSETASVNSTELQKQVPVKSLQDQFVLDLQEAGTVSNSQIKSMSFTDGGAVDTGSTQQAAATTNSNQPAGSSSSGSTQTNANSSSSSSSQQSTQSTSTASNSQQNTQTAGTAGNQQQAVSPVSGLTKITAQLSIVSSDYDELETFINTLESMKRIIVVEAINYTGSKEITSLSDSNAPLTYTLTVSAYYMPGLSDLQKELPKADYPEPANKTNPQASFADLTKP